MLDPHSTMVERLEAFGLWIADGNCIIKDRYGQLVALKPNTMQKRIYTNMMKQAVAGKPIRLVGLKARKHGFSTFIEALQFFLAQNTPHWASGVIAHTDASTGEIFGIAQRMAQNIKIGPRPIQCRGNKIGWKHDSMMTLGTAGGQYAFSGATIQAAHLSELGKWSGSPDFVKSMLASIMQSVPKVNETIVVIESTANMLDLSGQFEEYWESTKEPFNPYVGMFFPWFEEPTYSTPGGKVENLTAYEEWLVKEFGVTQPQLRWRRDTILGEFAGDKRFFRQEYPATEKEAFETPSGVIYPMLSEAKHAKAYDLEELLRDGYRVYRGIDFGGVDPFVCVWIAHKRGRPGFTVDIRDCPNAWRELTKYHWNANKQPADVDDHTCFAAGTMVATPDGERPIESIRAGDMVLSHDGASIVEDSYCSGIKPVCSLIADGARRILCTGDHPIALAGGGFLRADQTLGKEVAAWSRSANWPERHVRCQTAAVASMTNGANAMFAESPLRSTNTRAYNTARVPVRPARVGGIGRNHSPQPVYTLRTRSGSYFANGILVSNCDAIRYIVHFFSLSGHVHVFRELYRPNSAMSDISILDLTEEIKRMSTEPVRGTVADRSRPDSIMLMAQHGVNANPFKLIERKNMTGEKIDGIMRLQAMMVATLPLRAERRPEPWELRLQKKMDALPQEASAPAPFETLVAMKQYEQDYNDLDPIFGAYV